MSHTLALWYFVLQTSLCAAHVQKRLCLCDYAKDTHMEKALLSCDLTINAVNEAYFMPTKHSITMFLFCFFSVISTVTFS